MTSPLLDLVRQLIAQKESEASALKEAEEAAKKVLVIGPISDEQRIAAIEALLARQHVGSPAPGDAEKIRAIERLLERRRREAAVKPPSSSPIGEAARTGPRR